MVKILDDHYSFTHISENFMAIVNERHYNRLIKLIDPKKVHHGGKMSREELFISPTILDNITFDDPVMKEEIFGPILPVIRYDSLDDVFPHIKKYGKPLSLYIYGKKSAVTDRIFNELSFGGGSLNDSVMYFANDHLPLGGVGASGIGAYHGIDGFKTFSHYKAIMEKSTLMEFWFLKTLPYTELKLKILRLLLEKL
jgi:aldehyde dehydrogenase (NAD+)